MNYRHAYHAGNHADVLKHVVLTRVIERLKLKDKPFRFIDAHAGIGVYDLMGVEAGKTGEWETGYGKMTAPFSPEVETLIQPYRDIISGLNFRPGDLVYPGSPHIATCLLRPQDTMVFNELHPDDCRTLADRYRLDKRVRATMLDAGSCVKANLPPPERRGLVLIDPPYERTDEAEQSLRMIAHGLRRFASAVFILWYPLKHDAIPTMLAEQMKAMAVNATLQVELRVREAFQGGGLAGSGLIIANSPWQLNADLDVIVPALASRLGLGSWGQATVKWLVPPA